jgi:hypothetical protein
MKKESFYTWFTDRAIGSIAFGIGGSIIGFLLGIETLGIILGVIVGWLWADHNRNRGNLSLGGESFEQRDRRIKEEERWRHPDEENK